jgi:hypothetical protein
MVLEKSKKKLSYNLHYVKSGTIFREKYKWSQIPNKKLNPPDLKPRGLRKHEHRKLK